jgi:hypothetical protein
MLNSQLLGKRKATAATATDSDAPASKSLKVSKVSQSKNGELSSIAGSVVEIGLQALKLGTTEEQKAVAHFNALLDNPESDLVNSALLIKAGLTARRAKKLLDRRNLPFKLYFQHDSKELFAYEQNGNDVHEAIVAEVTKQLAIFAQADGRRLVVTHGPNIYGGRTMNADQCLGLKPTPPPTLPPVLRDRLVLQVGVSQSVASLHSHAAHLFANNTGVQVYVFLKIWERRADWTRAACAAVYRRGQASPMQLMSIGDVPPTEHFLQFFTSHFPNLQLPEIQNLNVIPATNNADLFSITIPGAWILPSANPALADLVINCSGMADLIKYM